MGRIERLLADENVRSISTTLANLEQATTLLPETLADARTLAGDLRRISAATLTLTTRVNETLEGAQPDLRTTLANARTASETLVRTADGIERLLNNGTGAFGRSAGAGVAELQQLVIDARGASSAIRDLARELRERPSSLLREREEAGVEMPQ
jgi:phospholipid/cholesterol/gamma-HCH transport system substrate-binding protein